MKSKDNKFPIDKTYLEEENSRSVKVLIGDFYGEVGWVWIPKSRLEASQFLNVVYFQLEKHVKYNVINKHGKIIESITAHQLKRVIDKW